MNLDAQFSWTLAQTGKVSVSHQHMRGIVMNKVHIQCDCISNSLLSDIACTDMPRDSRPEPNWLDTQLQQKAKKEAEMEAGKAGGSSKRSGKRNLPPEEKTLVMRVNSVEFKDNELLLTNGELTLQGEDVIVKNGVTYFQNKSQLGQMPSTGPPVLRGSQMDNKRLEALASKKGGSRNLYYSNSKLLLDGNDHRPLIQDPEIQLGSQVIPVATVAKTSSSAESISEEVLKKILPNYKRLSDEAVEVQPAVKKKASKVDEEAAVESNKVVMVNSRCILKDNSIVALRGLLHVGCAWHRVNSGLLIGSNPDTDNHPVTISGTPVYKDATACEQLLLNNVTLYSRGSTIYAGNTALLENAVLHADGKKLRVEDLHLVGICGMEPPEDPEPARLFVQGGKFTVSESSLDVLEGTVWFKDVKVKMPEDSTEEVRVQDSIVFVPPDLRRDSGANGAPLFENRDIIYKDNMLLLDDLAPLLKGGFMSHENKQQPLAWLSDDPRAMQRASQVQITPSADTRCDRDNVLSDGVCILDNTGMYVIEGTMIVNDKKVIVSKGVPLFSSDFSTEDRAAKHLEMMPPRLTGHVLLDADGARDLGAKFVKGFAVLSNVNEEIKDGKLIMNQQVPVISDCKLILNQRVYYPSDLGMNTQPESEDDGRGSYGVSSEPKDSVKAQVIEKGAKKNQQQPQRGAQVNDGSIKPKAPPVQAVRTGVGKPDSNIDALRASDPYDSGRGTSAFDSGLSDNDRTRTNENQEMPEPQRLDIREPSGRVRTAQDSQRQLQPPGNNQLLKSSGSGVSESERRDNDGSGSRPGGGGGRASRGQDGRMSDGRGQDGHKSNRGGQDSRKSDNRGQDGRMSDGRGQDSRMSDGRGQDSRASDGRSPDGPMSEGRGPDGRVSDGRGKDGRVSNGRGQDGRSLDGRSPDGRILDGRKQDGRMMDSHDQSGRMSDGRGPDGRLSDGPGPDGRMSGGRMSDGTMWDNRMSDYDLEIGRRLESGRLSDGRGYEGRMSDGRGQDGPMTDGRKQGRGKEGRMLDDRGKDGRMLDDRGKDGRMSDGRGKDGRMSNGRGRTSDGRSPDGRSSDGRSPDGRSPDVRSPDGRSPDGHSPDGRSPDGRRPDGRKTDGRGRTSDGHSPDGRSPDGRSLDDRSPDDRSPDGRSPDGRSPDDRSPDGRMSDGRGRTSDGRSPDGSSPDVRSPNGRKSDGRGRTSDGRGRTSDGRSPDGISPDGSSPDGRSLDVRSPHGRSPDGRKSNGRGRTSEGRSPDGRSSDGRNPDGRNPDGRSPDGRSSDGRMSDGRSPDSRTSDGRSPDGRMSNGRVRTSVDRSPDGRMPDGRGRTSDGHSPDGHYQDGHPRDSRGQRLDSGRPVDGVQSADDPRPSGHRQSAGSGGRPPRGRASARNRDNVFGPAPPEHRIPQPTLTDEASAGMLGSIWVASNQGNQLVVSLRSRIEKSLHFLDGDK